MKSPEKFLLNKCSAQNDTKFCNNMAYIPNQCSYGLNSIIPRCIKQLYTCRNKAPKESSFIT